MHLFLNGGGDGPAVADARAKLNQVIDHQKKVLYIPFAWEDETYAGCIEFLTQELGDVETAGIEMVRSGKELYEKKISEYLSIIRNNRNTSSGNGAHASYLLTEEQLDDNIKAFTTLYLYVVGMNLNELKAKYDI